MGRGDQRHWYAVPQSLHFAAMMRSAVTISLTPEARGGPFIFWDDLAAGCRKAAELGFDGVEIFTPDAAAVDEPLLRRLLSDHGLKVAAFGTGAGWVKHKLTLTAGDPAVRQRAREFVRAIVDLGGRFEAPAIVGSMQGRAGELSRDEAMGRLMDAMQEAGDHARQYGVPVILEPLNRYETNLVNDLTVGVALILALSSRNVALLADLFHLNIEEVDIPTSIRVAGEHIGHVHLADSNRRPAGKGHLDFAAIAAALRDMEYRGYLAAEALPYPDPDAAARQTIEAYRKWFASSI
jgi:sugar phosphate isomerase/epimerase